MFSISLKNTLSVPKIIPTPRLKKKRTTTGGIAHKRFPVRVMGLLSVILKYIITTVRTVREIRNVTKFERTQERGYMYFGTYTFLIMDAFDLMERIAFFVDEVKNS